MSWINDAHVTRGLLGAFTALATAALVGCIQLVAISTQPAPRVAAASRPAEAFAFRPRDAAPLMAASVPAGAFEDLYTPPAPPVVASEQKRKEAMEMPMLDIAMTLPEVPEPLLETGIASTYGVEDGFQGNRTACGQIFNTHVVQVAHKTLKCGTMIRIEDAETGKAVVAEVTDRGPYIRGRIVDLSWAAFRELDPAGGLRPVNVYLVD